MNFIPQPGTIVTCRQRQWVVLPSTHAEVVRLRPLSGNEDQICGIFTPLNLEKFEPAQFPAPSADRIQDHSAAQLLLDATRLSLRSGAGPFRCLGRLSLRPRPYQLVPLLMALRLEPIRLLIADDVGVGKTIEAGLILRELLDRGEIKRLAVLCPPQLCDQWQRELQQKFHIDAVVIRSGTVSQLERQLPMGDHHIFSYYPFIIVSLDYAKSERRRESFLAHCPDLVIVDEAHTCTSANLDRSSHQQRYQLIQAIAHRQEKHLILLTATPHSGIEAAFLSTLGLLKPEFAQFNLENLQESQRANLAQHFVQRRRADVQEWLDNTTPFPERESLECAYQLSQGYQKLFDDVYEFAKGLITKVDPSASYAQRRGRYWSALAILRCVMSSPAAAVATLARQLDKGEPETMMEEMEATDETLAAAYVYDITEQEQVTDVIPTSVIEKARQTYGESDKRKLREFVKAAEKLQGAGDIKLTTVIGLVRQLLQQGHHPIIWCRYIATANYVAQALKTELETQKNNIRVIAITGQQSEDEREIRLAELKSYPNRVMVATDCLSEGVNLQEHFTAALHYDLPWNPNRLEQREGRIDRYGQPAPQVKCILLYGENNEIDVAVLDVLIRKAVSIHKALGITVPVPMDSNTVQEAVFKSLFEKQLGGRQLSLFETVAPVVEVHQNWERAVEREKQNRTRFAQRAIKPDEVQRELEESDNILGTESDVERFVKTVCEKLNTSLIRKKQGWLLPNIPPCVQPLLGTAERRITFTTPAPPDFEYIGRNHLLVEGLARYLLEECLNEGNSENILAARCGVTLTQDVSQYTVILLLRLRHLISTPQHSSLLAEECLVRGFTGVPSAPQWVSMPAILQLLEKVKPSGNLKRERKQLEINKVLSKLPVLESAFNTLAQQQAQQLTESHRRVRRITQEGIVQVKPQLPMDILGIYILQPDGS